MPPTCADHFVRPDKGSETRDPQAETSKLEREIDQLVYQLYGLTEEEIGIVEGTRP